ncbi:DNA-directed RNA polymerase subunit beta', partial [Dirofilaria immitis]
MKPEQMKMGAVTLWWSTVVQCNSRKGVMTFLYTSLSSKNIRAFKR